MPLPSKGEKLKDYIARFMSDPAMRRKYPNEKQRYKIALEHWEARLKKYLLLKYYNKALDLLKAKYDRYAKLTMQLANIMINTWDKQSKEAIADTIRAIVGSGPYKKTGPITKAEIDQRLKELSKIMGEDMPSMMRNPVNQFTEEIYAGEIKTFVGTGINFSQVDNRAIEWARENTMYWIGNHYDDHVSERVGKIAAKILEEGWDRKAAGAYFQKQLGDTFGRSKSYWELMSNHTVTRSREFGRVSAYQKANVEYLRISAVIDHRTSKICRALNGKIIPVSYGVETRDKLINSKDPEDVKKIAPWLTDDQIDKKIIGKPVKKMPKWSALPPYHARCRTRTIRATQEQWAEQEKAKPAAEIKWKPKMTQAEAKAWAKNSKIKDVYYHGTKNTAANNIKSNGFRLPKQTAHGRTFGNGIYLTPDKVLGNQYGTTLAGKKAETLQCMINSQNPLKIDNTKQWNVFKNKMMNWKEGKKYHAIYPDSGVESPELVTRYMTHLGYDSWVTKEARKPIIVVFDPKNIVVIGD